MALKCFSSLSRWSSAAKLGRRTSTRALTVFVTRLASDDAGTNFLRSPRQPRAVWNRQMSTSKKRKVVNVTFIDRDGDEQVVEAKVGDTLLEVAKEYDIDLEGACEGTLSCSTCHLILEPEWFNKIPDPLTEEEQDMLDLAFGLTDTSRLGCQILVSPELEGIKLKVPSATRDARNT